MLSNPIHVIGLGIRLGENLSEEARLALQQAEVVYGLERHLAVFPELSAETRLYPEPIIELWSELEALTEQRVVMLSSGDPLFFGIGSALARHMPRARLQFHANISSMQEVFSRIGIPWQDAKIISLHGQPLSHLKARLRAQRLYALFTDSQNNPDLIAAELVNAGFGDSRMWVAEDIGSAGERIREFRAQTLAASPEPFSILNIVIIETRGRGGVLPEFPGIADEDFSTDGEAGGGMMSRREIRLMILSMLQPRAGEVGWDVGAGCGGTAVEWARWNPRGQVYAVECREERLIHLHANRERFGVSSNLQVIDGYAPKALSHLPDPDAVFIGGAYNGMKPMLNTIWPRIKPGGRLVAAAVTEEARRALFDFADSQAQWSEINTSRMELFDGQHLLRPRLPVLLMRRDKPW